MGTILTPEESFIFISRLTDILTVLLFSIVTCTGIFIYLRDFRYNLILAFVLIVIVNVLYIFLKLKGKPPPPKDTMTSKPPPPKDTEHSP